MDYEVDVRKLDLFNEMAKVGASTVSDHLNQLSGLDTEIEVSKINFLDMADVKTHLGDEKRVGIYVQLQDPPHGYVLFTLEPQGGKRLARGLVDEMGGWPDEEIAFVIDSTIAAAEADVEVTVYTVLRLADLVGLIQRIDTATDVAEDTTASDVV